MIGWFDTMLLCQLSPLHREKSWKYARYKFDNGRWCSLVNIIL